MTSVNQTLPGPASIHAQSRQHAADGKEKGANFGEMVHGAEKAALQGKQSAEPVSPNAHPTRRPLAGPAKTQADQDGQAKTAAQKPATGKAAKNNADADHVKTADDADAAAQSSDAAPFEDRLPLLMALGDIRHFATSTNADRSGPAAEEEAGIQSSVGQSASSQLAARQGKRTPTGSAESPEPLQRSARATMPTEKAGPEFGQKPASAGPTASVRTDDIVLPGTTGTETDAAALQGWRPAAAQKTAQAVQSIASLNQAKPSTAGRMDVVGQQSFPAPAQNPISQTASALVEAIASDAGVQQTFSSASAAAQTANSVAVPTHVLKIELHPSELGVVTASLRLSGEQLSIEMKPQTHEAYRRLTADSEAIVKSMRGLGFEVDHVTILQPSIAAHSASRTDATSTPPMSAGRDQPSFQPGNSGGDSAGGGRQPGRNDSNGAQEIGRAASPLRERAGDDIYI
ncbi:flagellar hook-length control protein FliK [Mesorhizobium sp.]|uniref:flagellar hook-length control protein FliK n=1 Tax=Mesorhizobium sp. TaxID=1871066 RepID=UPI000FE9C428|nr:flagellar hook-length control protein FliK [Mesorhizobium sp.]RWM30751.1 MAG: flagellar hook-length control protein FliK [Mesorhizobium sp.]RWM41943.1 MAG: flagellar hook-length control protein FliK [Mesorhizobium sp.]TJV53988.1 MAG: flagellar hook-length control protein FliK [Mesorhizobium sp.]